MWLILELLFGLIGDGLDGVGPGLERVSFSRPQSPSNVPMLSDEVAPASTTAGLPRPQWLDLHPFRDVEWFVELYCPGYVPDHEWFTGAQDFTIVRLRGFMGFCTVGAIVRSQEYRDITAPAVRQIVAAWMGILTIVLIAAVMSLGGFGIAPVLLAVLAIPIIGVKTRRRVIRAMTRAAIADATFYEFALKNGVFTIYSTD